MPLACLPAWSCQVCPVPSTKTPIHYRCFIVVLANDSDEAGASVTDEKACDNNYFVVFLAHRLLIVALFMQGEFLVLSKAGNCGSAYNPSALGGRGDRII